MTYTVEGAVHPLSTLIAEQCDKEVVMISRKSLVGSLGHKDTKFCEEVALGVTNKFFRGGQYDYIVHYFAEIKCFVAVERHYGQNVYRDGPKKF